MGVILIRKDLKYAGGLGQFFNDRFVFFLSSDENLVNFMLPVTPRKHLDGWIFP